MNANEKSEMRALANTLENYQDQLLERHALEPAKSPPVFLLNIVINKLRRLGGMDV